MFKLAKPFCLFAISIAAFGFAAGRSSAIAQELARPADPVLIAAAKAEGSVLVYGTSSVAALQSDAEKFQRDYGIPVTFVQLTSGPITARVNQEIKAGGISADIVMNADRLAMSGWAASGALGKLPEIQYPDRTEFLAPIQLGYHGVAFNTDAVKKANVTLTTWHDVLNPAFSGQVVLGSPRISPAFTQLYYALLKDPNYGQAFFEKLVAMHPRVVDTPALVAQLTASGEAALGFPSSRYDTAAIRAKNPSAPVDHAYLDIVTLAPTYIAISAKPKHPNTAKLFALWMLSPAGQVAHNGEGRASTILGNLPGTLAGPSNMANLRRDVTVETVAPEYQSIIAMFDRLYK